MGDYAETMPMVKEFVKRFGFDRSNVSRQFRLATISPWIVETVFHGRSPDGMFIDKLMVLKSDDWEEQNREVGLLGEELTHAAYSSSPPYPSKSTTTRSKTSWLH